jgi:hypothetical protein
MRSWEPDTREPLGILFWAALLYMGASVGGVLWLLRHGGVW